MVTRLILFIGCRAVRGTAAGLRMEPKHHRFGVGGSQLFHHLRPHAAGCAELLGDFLQKIVVRIEEKERRLPKTSISSPFAMAACT